MKWDIIIEDLDENLQEIGIKTGLMVDFIINSPNPILS